MIDDFFPIIWVDNHQVRKYFNLWWRKFHIGQANQCLFDFISFFSFFSFIQLFVQYGSWSWILFPVKRKILLRGFSLSCLGNMTCQIDFYCQLSPCSCFYHYLALYRDPRPMLFPVLAEGSLCLSCSLLVLIGYASLY